MNRVGVYVARFFWTEGVTPAVLRKAREMLATELGTRHPFAHADLLTDGKPVILKTADGDLRDVVSRQHFFRQMKLGRFRYDRATRLAECCNIDDGVVIDTRVSFGKPIAEGFGVTTHVLANHYRANGSNAAVISDQYGVTPADVAKKVSVPFDSPRAGCFTYTSSVHAKHNILQKYVNNGVPPVSTIFQEIWSTHG